MSDNDGLIFAGSVVLFLSLIFGLIMLAFRRKFLRSQRYIDDYVFPTNIKDGISSHHPKLSSNELEQVCDALRIFFHTQRISGKYQEPLAMPSKVVDAAWHEFILNTQAYTDFCQQAFGRFLHHSPAESMSSQTEATEAIRRAWAFSCKEAKINPKKPEQLPILFAIDATLNIENGFYYSLDCSVGDTGRYCVAHIGQMTGTNIVVDLD